MIYDLLRSAVGTLLKVPLDPPAAPAGAAGSLRVFRASRKWLHYRLLGFYVGCAVEFVVIVMTLGGTLLSKGGSKPILLAGLAIGIIVVVVSTFISYAVVRLDYDLRYYQITDRSLRIREGAWQLREVTITYANVQDVRIMKGPLQQLFGIADLVVQTAGGAAPINPEGATIGAGHYGVFRGIENPEGLRDEILALLRRHKDAGLGDPDDRRRSAATRPTGGTLSALALQRLVAIRDELRAARAACS